MDIQIYVEGHADDLYALSLLFPEGAYPDLHVVTGITGHKDGLLDKVSDASQPTTYVTGPGCVPLLEAEHYGGGDWVAREIIAPLNGYAALADANFKPVVPVRAEFQADGKQGWMIFGSTQPDRPTRLVTTNSHAKVAELRNSRVYFMVDNPLAAYAAAVVAGPPSWADYYRLLEDIAGRRGTSLDKLGEAGLAEQKPLEAFKKAANNRAFGRHGASKHRESIPQESLMNLLEAREFVRRVAVSWLDAECGGRMPRNRVDGGPLRFGLDDQNDG